jgi:SAM-dependent methyltransferase
MTASDTQFAGSIPAIYDRCLRSLLFGPYAEDLAARAAETAPRTLLETAAGTGIVTAALAERLPESEIVATDLNPAMLEIAAARVGAGRVRFQLADAQDLPFDDESFDAVVCQFGVMFFPDRVRAYREARRVLGPGGRFLFNAWDRIEDNVVTDVATRAVAEMAPGDPPDFFRRVPHGYGDVRRIEADLEAAGFRDIHIETVEKASRSPSPREAATGLCQGTPLRSEIEARGLDLAEATDRAAGALEASFGPGPIEAPMSAHVVVALR